MTSAVPHHRHTFQEYLLIEEMSPDVKHEYLDGEIYAMSGGTMEHAALCLAVGARLFALTAGSPCRAYGPDLRIRVRRTGLATYPDAAIVCGEPEHDPESRITCTNPAVIVEVLSPSSEKYDRGAKREHYLQIDSLRQYVIIAQNRRHAEQWTREADGVWVHREIGPEGEIVIETIGQSFSLAELYSSAGL